MLVVAQIAQDAASGQVAARLLGYLTVWNLLGFSAAVLVALVVFGKVPLRYNVRNLTIRWKTTVMTALAFTAVIALLTVMMAFVNGMRKMTRQSGQPGNVLVLSDGATDEIISNLTVGDLAEIENLPAVEHEGSAPVEPRDVPGRQSADSQHGRPAEATLPPTPRHRGSAVDGSRSQSGTSARRTLVFGGGRSTAPGAAAGDTAPLVQAVLGEGVAHELARGRSAENLARPKPQPARRRRHVHLAQSHMADRRRAEVERHDLQLGDLGQAFVGGLAIRQRHLHDARAPRQRRGSRQGPEGVFE